MTGLSAVLCGVYFLAREGLEEEVRVDMITSVFFVASLSTRVSAFYTPVLAVIRQVPSQSYYQLQFIDSFAKLFSYQCYKLLIK